MAMAQAEKQAPMSVEDLGIGPSHFGQRHAGNPSDHRLEDEAFVARRTLGIGGVNLAAGRQDEDRKTFFGGVREDGRKTLGVVLGDLHALDVVGEFIDEDAALGEGSAVAVDKVGGGAADPVPLGELREGRFVSGQQQRLSCGDFLGDVCN